MKLASTCLLVFLASAEVGIAGCPSESFIQNVGLAFMSAARSGDAGSFSSAASRFSDVRSLALFALGPYRKNLPKNREAEYVALTKKFMGSFMSRYASRFSGTSIEITRCAGNIVTTKLSTGQGLVFRLRGSHHIEDVSVSGVWLAQTLRSRFVGVLSENNGDVDALLEWLRG
jgi:ABC-type transporter MlaC component